MGYLIYSDEGKGEKLKEGVMNFYKCAQMSQKSSESVFRIKIVNI